MPNYKEFRPHIGQQYALRSDARFVGMICGSGGGKSFLGPVWLYREIAKHPGEEWMIVAPSYKLLIDVAVKELIDFFKGTDAEGEFKAQPKIYHLPDGGRIYCRSADKAESLEGIHAKGIWFDEAGQVNRWKWVVAQGRVAQKQGRMLLTSTPYYINWMKNEFSDYATIDILDESGNLVRHKDGGDQDYYVINFPSTLNPYFSQEEFERQRRILTDKEFNLRYMGKFEQLAGAVYPDFQECVVEQDDYVPKMADRRIGAVDPGMSDPFAGITAVYGQDDKLHLKRELYEPNKLLRDLIGYLDPNAVYYADPAARREWEELSALGIDIRPADNSIKPGIMKVREFLSDGRIVIPKDDFPNLISEMGSYVFKENEDKPDKSTPHHLLDTIRYLVMGLEDSSSLNIYAL